MSACGDYIDGVIFGPRIMKCNERFSLDLCLSLKHLNLKKGIYYITIEVGTVKEKDAQIHGSFLVVQDELHAIIPSCPFAHDKIIQAQRNMTIHLSTNLIMQSFEDQEVEKDEEKCKGDELEKAYIYLYEQDIKIFSSLYFSNIISHSHISPHEINVKYEFSLTQNEGSGKYFLIVEFANKKKVIVTSIFYLLFIS
jgi:hypothetical protein